jgi:hypothetical protein
VQVGRASGGLRILSFSHVDQHGTRFGYCSDMSVVWTKEDGMIELPLPEGVKRSINGCYLHTNSKGVIVGTIFCDSITSKEGLRVIQRSVVWMDKKPRFIRDDVNGLGKDKELLAVRIANDGKIWACIVDHDGEFEASGILVPIE